MLHVPVTEAFDKPYPPSRGCLLCVQMLIVGVRSGR